MNDLSKRLERLEAEVSRRRKSNPICYEFFYLNGTRQMLDSYGAMIQAFNDNDVQKVVYHTEIGTDENLPMIQALLDVTIEPTKAP